MTDNLTGEVSTPVPQPEPGASPEGFTLGQGEVGETKLEDGDHGLFGFLVILGIAVFFLVNVVYARKKQP